ncbi:MAG: bacterio-opsin activator [Clostridium sp.]|nr:bacterio-opsin activator [Clostridium sp.]
MEIIDNQYRIYIKSTREWVAVPEEVYREHVRHYDSYRKKQKGRGECACPKSRFWLCDGDCLTCEFHCSSMDSLDYTVENKDGDTYSLIDQLCDPSPSLESIICDKVELDRLFARLNELMPEAIEIGRLRQQGLSDSAIADALGIRRTTFLSRLKKVKALLADEYPDFF